MQYPAPSDLSKLFPHGKGPLLKGFCDGLRIYGPAFDLTTIESVAHFTGQCAHESAAFTTLEEYSSGKQYEHRADLGNVQPGDGPLFKGRGYIQLTGRVNYQKVEIAIQELKTGLVDVMQHPEFLSQNPEYGFLASAWFWRAHNLGSVAVRYGSHLAEGCSAITETVNGKARLGLSNRLAYTQEAYAMLRALQRPQVARQGADIPALIATPLPNPAQPTWVSRFRAIGSFFSGRS